MDCICDHPGVEPSLLPVALIVGIGVASGVLSSLAGAGGSHAQHRRRAAPPAPRRPSPSVPPSRRCCRRRSPARSATPRPGSSTGGSGLTTGGAGALLAVAGAVASSQVDARLLMVACSVILAASGVGLLRSYRRSATVAGRPGRRRRPAPAFARARARWARVSGFVAGLLGLGGGLIVVPAFTRLLRMPLRTRHRLEPRRRRHPLGPGGRRPLALRPGRLVARAGADRRRRPGRPPRLAARRRRLGGDRRHGVRCRARRRSPRCRRSPSSRRSWADPSVGSIGCPGRPQSRSSSATTSGSPCSSAWPRWPAPGTGWLNLYPETVEDDRGGRGHVGVRRAVRPERAGGADGHVGGRRPTGRRRRSASPTACARRSCPASGRPASTPATAGTSCRTTPGAASSPASPPTPRPDEILAWLMSAIDELCPVALTGRWLAEVHAVDRLRAARRFRPCGAGSRHGLPAGGG